MPHGPVTTPLLRGSGTPSERPGERLDRLADGPGLVAHRASGRVRDRFAPAPGAQPPDELRQSTHGMPEPEACPAAIPARRGLLRLLEDLQPVSLQCCEQAGREVRGQDIELELRPEGSQPAPDA